MTCAKGKGHAFEHFERFRDFMLESVRRVGDTFKKPDDDWSAVLFLEGEQPAIAALAGDKRGWPKAVDDLFREMRPRFAALVMSTWTLSVDVTNMPPALRELQKEMLASLGVRDHPGREEAVLVEVARPGHSELWKATILRDEKLPPQLGEFAPYGPANAEGGAQYSGRLAQVLGRAFEKLGKEGAKQ